MSVSEIPEFLQKYITPEQRQELGLIMAGVRENKINHNQLVAALDLVLQAAADIPPKHELFKMSSLLRLIKQSMEKGSIEQQLELTIPIIPALLSYKLNIHSTAGLQEIWNALKYKPTSHQTLGHGNKRLVTLIHAQQDTEKAKACSNQLTQFQLSIHRESLRPNNASSCLEIIDQLLSAGDYCLLLWSTQLMIQRKAQPRFLKDLFHQLDKKRVMVLIVRLDDAPYEHNWPVRRPGSYVIDLFPDIKLGLDRLAEVIHDDQQDRSLAKKPLVPPYRGTFEEEEAALADIFVTSHLFDFTFPVPVDLNWPAGYVLERLLTRLNLPKQISIDNRIGMEFKYRLLFQEKSLDSQLSLFRQGIQARKVLVLEIEARNFESVLSNITLENGGRVYRQGDPEQVSEFLSLLKRLGLRN